MFTISRHLLADTAVTMKRSTTPMAKTHFIIFILFVVSANSQEAKEWALLVAGSNGYDNYRHQVK